MGKRKLARAPSGREKAKAKAKPQWKFWAIVAGVVVVLGGGLTYWAIQSAETTARVGSPAPDFSLRLLSGESVTLSSLRGKPVVVNFWAST